MSKLRSLLSLLRKPGMLFLTLAGKNCFNWLQDRTFLKIAYFLVFGRRLNLGNPVTFNEKMQWLKLNDRNPAYSAMVDKYEVKKIISDLIGEEYLIPTLGVWESANDIDLKQLPERFVLKCTHDSGSVLICKDRSTFDFEEARKKLNVHLRKNPYWFGREWPYRNVAPRIIAEEYLEDEHHQLADYKMMCFNGKAKCCFIFTDRFASSGIRLNVYDREWNPLPVGREYTSINPEIIRPKNYEQMLQLAEKVAAGLPFARVDFYELNGRLLFGEITFYPNSGLTRFKPQEWDTTFGSWITLPKWKEKELTK